MLPRRAVEALHLAWGPGSRIPPDDHTEQWSADSTHAALKLINETSDSWMLQLNSYEPLRSWLGAGPTVAAVPAAVWSGPLTQVAGAHPELAFDVKGLTIMLPSSEWSPAEGTQAMVHLDDQKVASQISMLLAYPKTKIRDQMLEAFEEKWGKAIAKNNGWTFEQTPNVELKDVDSGWSLTVTRPGS